METNKERKERTEVDKELRSCTEQLRESLPTEQLREGLPAEQLREGLPADLVVVIGRQYGGGGRMVGKKLADRLGLAYYDKELINEAARSYGFSPHILEQADERRPSALSSFFISSFGVSETYGPETLSGEGLYKVQSKVVGDIGAKGGCVIVGRTADYILRNHPHLASIFLHSHIEDRARRISERGETDSLDKARDIALKADKRRENYYNYFTGRKWGVASNYHLTLDSSELTSEQLTDVIENYLRLKFGR